MSDAIDNADDWRKALRFAALPGAVRVVFDRSVPEPNTVNHRLRSFRSNGDVIGDDRDYDLLKAALGPLERLADTVENDRFTIEYDMRADKLSRL